MPDTAQFDAPDVPKINWLYVGGGIFGVIVLVYLLNRSKGATGTVAAGTSINAALGSLEESALNQQGALSFAQNSINAVQSTQNDAFTNLNNVVSTGFTGVNANINSSTSGLTSLINTDVNGINQQLGSILGQETTTYNNLLSARQSMEGAFGANSDKIAALDAQIQSIFNEMEAGFSQLASKLNTPVAVQSPPSVDVSRGNNAPVHTYTVYLPGGGAIHTNSSTAAGALNNVPGGHF